MIFVSIFMFRKYQPERRNIYKYLTFHRSFQPTSPLGQVNTFLRNNTYQHNQTTMYIFYISILWNNLKIGRNKKTKVDNSWQLLINYEMSQKEINTSIVLTDISWNLKQKKIIFRRHIIEKVDKNFDKFKVPTYLLLLSLPPWLPSNLKHSTFVHMYILE